VAALSIQLGITLPPWVRTAKKKDNWQGGPWDQAIQAQGLAAPVQVAAEHF
jgi:hypothetical protein